MNSQNFLEFPPFYSSFLFPNIKSILFIIHDNQVHNYFDNSVYIALGSNKGNKLNYIKNALIEIEKDKKNIVVKVSSVYETTPYGNIDQENFLNCAACIETAYSIKDFFHLLKSIENKLGRKKTVKWGPREIDIDLLFFNDQLYSDNEVKVPHQGIPYRDFVLVPLCEIAPNLIHPELNKKICDICTDEKYIIKKLDKKFFKG
jgi:2-amino-4-hydroxy-6-hydroxymethyldihydropteridine diphosphokinase